MESNRHWIIEVHFASAVGKFKTNTLRCVQIKSSKSYKSTATTVDPPGSITAEFWAERVDCDQLEKMYIFTNLSVKDLILGVKTVAS